MERREFTCTRGSGWFVQARRRGNARAHRSLHSKCHRVSGHIEVCASVRDRRGGLPIISGRQAASPSPNRELDTDAGGDAWCEWLPVRQSSTLARPNAASSVILGRRPRAPSAVGRVRSAGLLVVLFDDAPDRPCCACSFVPLYRLAQRQRGRPTVEYHC